MTKKLYVGRLPYGTTDSDLEEFFSKVGKVVSAKAVISKRSGQVEFGFVEMETEDEAARAIEELNNKELGGRNVVVNEAREQQRSF